MDSSRTTAARGASARAMPRAFLPTAVPMYTVPTVCLCVGCRLCAAGRKPSARWRSVDNEFSCVYGAPHPQRLHLSHSQLRITGTGARASARAYAYGSLGRRSRTGEGTSLRDEGLYALSISLAAPPRDPVKSGGRGSQRNAEDIYCVLSRGFSVGYLKARCLLAFHMRRSVSASWQE